MKPTKPAAEMSVQELAAYIDHSVLKPEFTPAEVRAEVQAAIAYGCKTVCINPASIEIAAFSIKDIPNHTPAVTPRYVGAHVPDAFVVGYGLDYAERYRNLPYVGILKPEAYS